MQNHYLKASSAESLTAALIAAGVMYLHTEEGGESVESVSPGYSLDIIGQISKPTGETLTVDGIETPEMTVIAGYHANLAGELSDEQIAALAGIILTTAPENPYRVWM